MLSQSDSYVIRVKIFFFASVFFFLPMSKAGSKKTLNATFPRIPAFKEVGEYRNSTKSTKQVLLPGYDWDRARNSDPEQFLQEARRNYDIAVDELILKKQYFEEEKIKLQKQWEDLQNSEDNFKGIFEKMSEFISSNQSKRSRAAERKIEDAKLIKRREIAVKTLQERIAALETAKQEVDKEIEEHKMYEAFLHKVVAGASDSEFKNSTDLIDRYESLMATKTELAERQNTYFELLENSKLKMSRAAEENNFKLMGISNTLTTLQARYQTATTNAMDWERIVNSIKDYSFRRFKEITEVRQSCRNVYLLMCRRKDEAPKIPEEDFEKQLLYIKRTLKQLSVVRTEAEGVTKKTFSSMKGETSKVS